MLAVIGGHFFYHWCVCSMAGANGMTVEDLMRRLEQIQTVVDNQQTALTQQQGMIRDVTEQLQASEQRAVRAEADRETMVRLFGPKSGGSELVDTKGVGQPFKYSGKSDQDFSEWSHKMVTFLRAKYSSDVDEVLKWAMRQRKTIQMTPDTGNSRVVSWDNVFGSAADAIDQVDGMHSFVEGLYTYLVSFTTGEANKVVRNFGDDGLECWRRLNSEYDPSSSMRRVAILGLVQNPPRCKSVDELGSALESWLTKKRQYEEFTDRDGNPCRVSEDSLMAALYKLMPESLEEAVMFRSEDYPSFNDLFDKLTSYASTKHSLFLTKRDLQSHSSSSAKKDPDAMDIGAMSKGKKGDGKKGKTKGKMVCHGCGKVGHKLSECRSSGKSKGGDRIDMVKCWNCDGYGHYGKDCPSRFKGKSGGKPKGGGRAFGKKADDKGKGKGGKSANAVDESNTQEAATAELGFLDLCACSNSVESTPHYVVSYAGEDWLRVNYDSGAAATVVPPEVVMQEVELVERGEFTVASGEGIPRYCKVRLRMEDEKQNPRSLTATVAGVHKPLGSAAEFSKSHDCVLFSDGGYLIPKSGVIATGMRKELDRLIKAHGDHELLPIYREGNLYNFYLKRKGIAEEIGAVMEERSGCLSGEPRLATP